ncbi:MAG TPA: nuclear transport factor 2 family protein [Stellaceae bacterium]|jgi:ketosteroid isomerase-like protein|nr:nuclear transport factor 2 family protein [Stellaceae bacterium]
MRRPKLLLAVWLLVGASPALGAEPVVEVAQLMQQLDQNFNAGNLDAYMAPYADDAMFSPPNVPFRIEGKDDLRAYYAGTMQAFPTHRVTPRQTAIHVYDGRIAVVSRYNDAMFIDRNGHVTNFFLRQSYTWIKQPSGWSLIEQHYSTLPSSAP